MSVKLLKFIIYSNTFMTIFASGFVHMYISYRGKM